MTDTAIVRTNVGTDMTVTDVLTVAGHLAKSGYFKDATDVSKAVAKILYGQALGIAPVQAMMGIDIIEGKPAPSAGLTAALVLRSGRYNYRVIDAEADPVVIEWFRDGQLLGRSSFGTEDAKRAGLAGKQNYQRWPKAMRFSRALTAGARLYCADVFLGPVYTREELTDSAAPVDRETGEVIDVTPVVTPDNGGVGTPPSDWPGGPRDAATPWTPETLPVHEHADATPDYSPEDVADRATPPPADPPVREDAKGTGVRGALEACDGPGAMLDLLGRIDAIGQSHHRHNGLKLWAAAIIGTGSVEHMILASEVVSEWPADKPSRDYLISAFKAGVDGAAVPA